MGFTFFTTRTSFDPEVDLIKFKQNPEEYTFKILNYFVKKLDKGVSLSELTNPISDLLVILAFHDYSSSDLAISEDEVVEIQRKVMEVLYEQINKNHDVGIAIIEGVYKYEDSLKPDLLPRNVMDFKNQLFMSFDFLRLMPN